MDLLQIRKQNDSPYQLGLLHQEITELVFHFNDGWPVHSEVAIRPIP